jgi:hypothetical protein
MLSTILELLSVDVIDVWLTPNWNVASMSVSSWAHQQADVRHLEHAIIIHEVPDTHKAQCDCKIESDAVRLRAEAADAACLIVIPETGKTIFDLKPLRIFRIERDGSRVPSQSHHTTVDVSFSRTV